MIFFNFKKRSDADFQKIFMNQAIQVFNPLFQRYSFKIINYESFKSSSKIVFRKGSKHILILSQHEHRDGSFFEITIGGELERETGLFDGYHISINRLCEINGKKCKDFYAFPFGEKQSLKALKKAKNDFLSCALFFLETEEDLFDKVLKLKGIRK
ncbi:hypothetical protein ACKGJY_10325 [Hyunsoonleella sp. 2307UL5-6]|uniref:hypothetical protein n=1 Tax=Hyunsoonleella sp. 2307UL5-6 TaxID=3384768 RepID=UPI0039BD16D4